MRRSTPARNHNRAPAPTLALLALAGVAQLAQAQSVVYRYQENFDAYATTTSPFGPPSLTANGWIFRNQSANRTATYWRISDWVTESIVPTSGGRMLAANANWDNGTRIISSWMILPAVPTQQAGDVIQYVINGWAYSDNQIELRYSPSGGTSTGTTYSDVGDFTDLITSTPLTPNTWTAVSQTVPGNGRLALRWVNPQVTTYQSPSVYVDTLSITATAIDPPLPQNGETVTWTAAMSPITIRANTTIPAGGTVNVEPGVTINMQNNATLTVSGTLNLNGTQAARITVNHASNYPPAVEVINGALNAVHTTWTGQLRPSGGGQVLITDSSFVGPRGLIYSPLYMGTGYATIARTTFTNSELTISNYTLRLEDLTLSNTFARLVRDYAFMDNVVVDGKSLDVDGHLQGTWLHDLTVRNNTAGYGLGLGTSNFDIDPTVLLTNNNVPATLAGGILPGSVLPTTGNTNNYVQVASGDQGSQAIWSDAGLPYMVPSFRTQFGGSLYILPGVEVRLASDAGMINQVGDTRVLGEPENPVLFTRHHPLGKWYPLQNFDRFRHAILEGAYTAAAWPSQLGWGFMDDCIVRNNDLGVTGQAIVRKTQFLNNGLGADVSMLQDLLGETNPNAFEGNGHGVSDAHDARFNWWGSPDGPFAGDTVTAGVPFEPWRTERPDYTDYAPIVTLQKHSFIARPGNKMILTWTARDNGTIVRQRVLMSLDGDIVQGNLSEPVIVLTDNLAGDVRSFEFEVPAPVTRFFGASNIRVESIDNAGQIGWDDLHLYAEREEPGELVITSPTGGEFTAGQNMGQVCYQRQGTHPGGGSVNAYIHLENTDQWISLGGVTTNLGCLPLDLIAPWVSTDRARIVFSLFTGGGISQPEYYFGQPFTIRPHPIAGDAAPSITMSQPTEGQSVQGGSVLPIRWTASDDIGLRAFHVQVSTDAGRTWSFIARDLPADTTAYDWQLPDSTGNTDVRVKIVAVDLNFQDTAAVAAIAITPGTRTINTCSADFNGDGDTGTDQDIEAFFACIGGTCCDTCGSADFNNDGDTATDQDIEAFFRVLGGNPC
ncbi:MAG TPA: choice-of-anchor J domain-containing protein [Phycisphaerales bacterium]|nr:choice-of-anchor J domain-containing protein [Phycisphaerales bacterium]